MKNKMLSSVLAVILTVFLVASLPITVTAASNGVTKLKPGKTISTKLSGSMKHNVKYTESISHSTDILVMALYVDGKAKYILDASGAYGASVWLLDVNSNTTLIYSFIYIDNSTADHNVFYYSNGSLKQCGNIEYITAYSWDPVPIRAGQNEFIIRCQRQESSIGGYRINASFKYNTSSKKVSKASSAYDIDFSEYHGSGYKPGEVGGWKDNWGTVSRSFNTYTKAGGNTLSFASIKGERLRVQKVNIQKNAVYIQVMNEKGKTSWYKDPDKYMERGYFLEAQFGG